MPLPMALTTFNKAVLNKAMIHLAGHGPFVELEHVGRRSGTVFRTPLNAFRHGEAMTCALTYGSGVQWLRNIRAAGGCRMRMGREWLTLGAPVVVPPEVGMSRVPPPARVILRALGVTEFIEMPILSSEPA